MIVRGPRKKRDFTILDNALIRDVRLSYRARGVAAFVLSQPEGYRITSAELARQGTEGRDAVRAALAELEATGYLTRHQVRREDGTFGQDTVLHEAVLPAPDSQAPVPPALLDETAGQTGAWESGAGFPGANRRTKDEGLEGLAPSARDARSIVNEWWERRTPRPAQPYMAVVKVIDKILSVGWAPEAVVAALDRVPTVSAASMELELRRPAGRSNGSSPADGVRRTMTMLEGLAGR